MHVNVIIVDDSLWRKAKTPPYTIWQMASQANSKSMIDRFKNIEYIKNMLNTINNKNA